MRRRNKIAAISALLIMTATVAGCGGHAGSFDVEDSSSTKWSNLVAMVQFKAMPNQPRPYEGVQCPEITVLDGTSADRVYAKPDSDSNDNLRYQYSVRDVARDCRVDGNQISMKVGVEGKVLLGPAGSPGSFAAPIRVVIVRATDQAPVFSKLYHAPTNVAPGQLEGTFTLVTEPLTVSYTSAVHDYMIKVGFDSAVANSKKNKGATATPQDTAATQSPTSSDRPHRHHRRLGSDPSQQ